MTALTRARKEKVGQTRREGRVAADIPSERPPLGFIHDYGGGSAPVLYHAPIRGRRRCR